MLLTLAAGVALAEGVEAATGLSVRSKWPNDLWSARRKLAGILAEAVGGERRRRARLRHQRRLGRRIRRSCAIARRRSNPSSDGSSIARWCSSRRSPRSRARYDDLLDGRFDAILDAWRGRAPAASGARVTWTTPHGHAVRRHGRHRRSRRAARAGRRSGRAHRRGRSHVAVTATEDTGMSPRVPLCPCAVTSLCS